MSAPTPDPNTPLVAELVNSLENPQVVLPDGVPALDSVTAYYRIRAERVANGMPPHLTARDRLTAGSAMYRSIRRRAVLDLRIIGHDAPAIARMLSTYVRTVADDIHYSLQELADSQQGSTAQLVALESARLDKLAACYWPLAQAGDVYAGPIILRAIETRAKLHGLLDNSQPQGNAARPLAGLTLAQLQQQLASAQALLQLPVAKVEPSSETDVARPSRVRASAVRKPSRASR